MNKFVWLGLFLGTTIGGFVPLLWNASPFSLSAAVCSTTGGAIGIWLGFKFS